MNISVATYRPQPELEPFIESYWCGTFNVNRDADFNQQVIPNGCIELIMHLSDNHCSLSKFGDIYTKTSSYILLGIYSKPYTVKFSAPVNTLGIRFYPDGFRNILGIPPGEFLSTFEDGQEIVGKALQELYSKVRESQSIKSQISLVNDFFISRLAKNQRHYDNTHLAMQLIRERQGLIDFNEMIEKVPISLRQLQREFKNIYGLNITEYMRLSRLNAINKYMLSQPASLTELAYDLDFTDQSHFIREFKHYVGMSPGKFIRNKSEYIVNAV